MQNTSLHLQFSFLSLHRIFQTSAEDVTDDVLQLGEPGLKIKEPNPKKKNKTTPSSTITTTKQKRNRDWDNDQSREGQWPLGIVGTPRCQSNRPLVRQEIRSTSRSSAPHRRFVHRADLPPVRTSPPEQTGRGGSSVSDFYWSDEDDAS